MTKSSDKQLVKKLPELKLYPFTPLANLIFRSNDFTQSAISNNQISNLFSEKVVSFQNPTEGLTSHLLIDKREILQGMTTISTDYQWNIFGSIGALGISVTEKELRSSLSTGKIWFRIPQTIKINLTGNLPENLTSKDIALNLQAIFKQSHLLGRAVEISGELIKDMTMDSRITLASAASELGAIQLFIVPESDPNAIIESMLPDSDAEYEDILNIP